MFLGASVGSAVQIWHEISSNARPARRLPLTSAYAGTQSPKNRAVGSRVLAVVGRPPGKVVTNLAILSLIQPLINVYQSPRQKP